EFVVQLLGVLTRPQAVTHHGVLTDADQAAGLTDADAFGDVLQDSDRLVVGQARVEQGRALAFGEAVLAGAAIEQAALLRAVAHAHGQVAVTAFTVVGALRVLTAEAGQVIHGTPSVTAKRDAALSGPLNMLQKQLRAFNTKRTPP